MDKHLYDCIIIGAGPAGLGAAIYAARAGFDVLLLEKTAIPGGQIINTTDVDNYLGLPGIGGFELGATFAKHAESLGIVTTSDEVKGISVHENIKSVECVGDSYDARTIILAMGAHHSMLGVPGEKEYVGRGVSYCATCDGAFFRKKTVLVVGGGDVAVSDALFLSRMCEKVYLVHRRDELRAAQALQDALLTKDNVSVIWNSTVQEIVGDEMVTSVVIHNTMTNTDSKLDVSGVFVAVGMEPETEIVKDLVELDAKGYVAAGEDCKTNVPGIFAAGDIRTKALRQVITAVADGACAITSASEYLRSI